MREKPGDDIWRSLCLVVAEQAGSAGEQHCGSDRNLKVTAEPRVPMDLASAVLGPELMGYPPSLLSKQAEPADCVSVSRVSLQSLGPRSQRGI